MARGNRCWWSAVTGALTHPSHPGCRAPLAGLCTTPIAKPRDILLGQQRTWLLEEVDAASTSVTLVYDWEDTTEEEWLRENTFPHFPIETFTGLVAALAATVERGDRGSG